MTDRQGIAADAAARLNAFAASVGQLPVMVGFDGFVDSIISVVDKRHDAERFDAVETIAALGEKISRAAGMSSNYELVVKLEKLGGNGPIMANALLEAGLPVTYMGALGESEIEAVFRDFAGRCDACHSLCAPGRTDALEFADGKLMLGKYESLKQINWQRLLDVGGESTVREVFGRAKLISTVNWTMLPYIGEIWQRLADDVLGERDDRPLVFVDLADPEKRTSEDLKQGLSQCAAFQKNADVILGLNLKESSQVAAVLGVMAPGDDAGELVAAASAIREKLGVHCLVIHPRRGAAAARVDDGEVSTAWFDGPFVQKPKLSTGAGDNFNAGFCIGSLAGMPVQQCLCVGTATSGYYVRNAGSPTLAQLTAFCEELPSPV